MKITNLHNSPPVFKMEGVIDETADFSQLKAEIKSLSINCREVSRINSVGLKLWRDHFMHIRENKCKLKFMEISPTLVASMNYVKNLIEVSEADSICVPFYCAKCRKSYINVLKLESAKKLKEKEESIICSVCQSAAEVDEVISDYLNFLG